MGKNTGQNTPQLVREEEVKISITDAIDELYDMDEAEERAEYPPTNNYKSKIDYWGEVNKPIMSIFFNYFNHLNHKRINEGVPMVDGVTIRGILDSNNAYIDNLPDFPPTTFNSTALISMHGNDLAVYLTAFKEGDSIRTILRISSSDVDAIKSGAIYNELFKLALDVSNLKGSYMTIGDNALLWEVRELKELSFDDVFLPPALMNDLNMYTKLYDTREILQRYMFSGIPGTGKAQPLTSKILTPNGWTTMGEISVGDEVLTPNGDITKVIGVFPQGIKKIHQLKFKDGRTAEACGEHLWEIYIKGKKTIKTTKEIMEGLMNTNNKYKIKLIEPFDITPKKEFIIKPYLMGLLIGDGSFHETSLKLSTSDGEIISKVRELLDENHNIIYSSKYDYLITRVEGKGTKHGNLGNRYVQEIKRLHLNDKRSDTKFIPKEYLMGSINDRIELLKGLIDSDGTVDKSGHISYSTVSEKLAFDIQELIWSIGGIAKIKEKQTYYTYKGERKKGKLSYNIGIRYKNQKDIVNLYRKRKRLSDNYQYKDSLKNQIIDIKLISEEEAKCIMIEDNNHLYITDNYIVTHNTESTRAISKILNDKGVTIIKTNICKIIKEKFELATILAPSIIILDDIDLYLGDRNRSGVSALLGQFLDILDGVDKLPSNVGVIASTNAPHLIDLAAQRPGRFNKLLFFDELTKDNIKNIILKSLNSFSSEFEKVTDNDIEMLSSEKMVNFFFSSKSTGALIYEEIKNIKHERDILGDNIDLDKIIKELTINSKMLDTKLRENIIKNKFSNRGDGIGFKN